MDSQELKITVTPEITGLSGIIGQLIRTGEALLGLADALQRLSDGGPDAARTVPDTEPESTRLAPGQGCVCPYVISRTEHEAHTFTVDMDVSSDSAEMLSFGCPGHPVLPWHGHTDIV